jgi:hypothetical protein
MKKRNLLTLGDEFLEYCTINNIDDIDKLAKSTFQRGFTILKFGETPSNTKPKEITKEVIKEVIKEVQVEVVREVIKEVPVEVIKEIIKEVPVDVIREIIREVPIEVIREVPIEIKGDVQIVTNEVIKEVPIEVIKEITVEVIREVPIEVIKEIKVVDNIEIERLQKENELLKNELKNITENLEKMGRTKYLKNSDLSNLYDE